MLSTGMNFTNKPTNEVMRNTTNSSKPYQTATDDKFSRTEWAPQKSYERYEKPVK